MKFKLICAALFIGLGFLTPTRGYAQADFTAVDIQIGDPTTTYLNIEFSPDMNYMAWLEAQGANGSVWLCGVDPVTGLLIPSNGKGIKLADTRKDGAAQWGQDKNGYFVAMVDLKGEFVIARPTSATTATITTVATTANQSRRFPYPARLADRDSFIAYTQADSTGEDQLWVIDLATPSVERQLTEGAQPKIGRVQLPAFIVTIYRWMYQAETRGDGVPQLFWGDIASSGKKIGALRVKSVDVSLPTAAPVFVTEPPVSYFDVFPYLFEAKPYLLTGLNAAAKGAVFALDNGLYSKRLITFEPSGSALKNPSNLASAEAFVYKAKLYTAFQVNEPGFPGMSPGEMWLTSLTDASVMRRISAASVGRRADPEFFIGKDTVWIFYYQFDKGIWQLRRMETGL